MSDVTTVSSQVTATVNIGVTGTEALVATYQTRSFQPGRITVTYVYKPQRGDDGWTRHTWVPAKVSAVGPRILKPAADGSQRLGVEELRYNPVNLNDAPEWLRKIISELTPSGDVTLVGN